MKNSILIEGHSCRWYFAGKCWVSEDGKYAYYTNLKSASNLNGNLNCSKELEHYAS